MTSNNDLHDFVVLIEERCGISYKKNDVKHLRAALETRMVESAICDLRGYLKHLEKNHEEFHHLIEMLTINETYFFREEKQLDLLCGKIISKLLLSGGGRKIRILSIGCSDGSEIYSIVMKLLDRFGDILLDRMEFLAGDIDRNVLRKAQNGIYGKHSFRTGDDAYKRKYFENKGLVYILDKKVRDRVSFYQINLLGDIYPEEANHVDVIFYRNVSIYFEPGNQRRVFRKLSGLLNEGGYIFVSSTEVHQHHQMHILQICEDGDLFYFRKMEGHGDSIPHVIEDNANAPDAANSVDASISFVSLDAVPLLPNEEEESAGTEPRREEPDHAAVEKGTADIKRAVRLAQEKNYKSSLECLELILAERPVSIDALTLKASVLLNLGKADDAKTELASAIDINPHNIEALILQGVVEKNRSDISAAIRHFRTALFLAPTIWFTHFNLAELLRMSGKYQEALKEYNLAKSLLLKYGLNNTGLTFFPFSFKTEQLIKLFDSHINDLSGNHNSTGTRLRKKA